MKAKLSILLAKIETTYGTDPIPSKTTDVITVQNVDFMPLEHETDDNNEIRLSFGKAPKIIGAMWGRVSFEVLLSGGGLPLGTLPNHAILMRACGVAMTVNAGADVTASLVSAGEESITIWFYIGTVLYKMTGARGTWETVYEAKKAPRMKFTFTGLAKNFIDGTVTGPTIPTLQPPLAVVKGVTTVSIAGVSAFVSSYSINLGNDVQYRNLTGVEEVIIADRTMSGKIKFELPPVATQDLLGNAGIITLGSQVSIPITHGTTGTGNFIKEQMTKVQLFKPVMSEEAGILMLECDMHITYASGSNDGWSRTYT